MKRYLYLVKSPELFMSDVSGPKTRYMNFLLFAIAACAINMATTNFAGYADTFTNTVYVFGIAILITCCAILKMGHILTSLIISTIFFNLFFSIFSYWYGMRSLICAYYFPFLISFVYMFKDQYSKLSVLVFVTFCFTFLFSLILFCPMDPTSSIVTAEHVSIMYKKNFIFSIALSFYFFFSIYTFMIAQNKSLQEQKEIAEDALTSKARFLSVMSHELRTPLNGIVGVINLMNGPTTEKDGKRFLHILKTSSHHLLQLVNNVLDFSKASAGKLELSPTPSRIDEILENLYAVFVARYNEKGIALQLSIDNRLSQTVLLDDVRFVQVLTNLLSNALKFTEEGEVCIHARAINVTNSSIEVEINVSDTGKGISEEQKMQIFDSFNNIYNKSKKVESTGLGLSISKMVLELMHSELKVESTVGSGSRFFFKLTLDKAQSVAIPAKELRHEPVFSMEGIKVLVAEDNPINMIIAREFLKRWKINMLEAVNGVVAQQMILEQKDIDLILLDLQMPEMDGYEVMAWLSKNNISIPTIAFTANMLATEERKQLLQMGFTAMVSKPFAPADLEEKMKSALQKKQTARTIAV